MSKAPITDIRVIQYYVEGKDGQPEFERYDTQFQRQGEDGWHTVKIAEHVFKGQSTFTPRAALKGDSK